MVQLIRGKADVSTSIHEVSGHWFENVLRDHADYGPIVKRVYGDLGSEKFARHVEQYFLTGKAPVASLKEVFEAIGTWMKQIYCRFQHGTMPDEVRAVFDRIHSADSPRVRELLRQYHLRYSVPKEIPSLPSKPIRTPVGAVRGLGQNSPGDDSTQNGVSGKERLSLAVDRAMEAGLDPAVISGLVTSQSAALQGRVAA